MNLTDQEREELFADFLVRMTEMDKEDKKVTIARNNSALKGMSRYFNKVKKEGCEGKDPWMMEHDPGDPRRFFNYYGIYEAYCNMRKVVPLLVNIKKHANEKTGYYHSHNHRRIAELDPEEDLEEATRCGKFMIDAMIKYLREE